MSTAVPTRPPATTAGGVAAILAAAVAVATLVLLALAADPPAPAGRWAADLVAAAVMVAGAWAAVPIRHPHAAAGMTVAVTGALLPLWARSTGLPASARADVLAAAPLAVAGVAHIALFWSPPRRRYTRGVPSALAGAAAVVLLAGYDPFADPGCALTCVQVRPLLGDLLSTRVAVAVAAALTVAAAATAGLWIVVDWTRSTAVPRVLAAAALAALATLAGRAVAGAAWWAETPPVPVRTDAWVVAAIGLALCAVAALTMRRRALIAQLVASLAAGTNPADGAVSDLHVAIPGEARWVDAAGRPVHAEPAGALILSDGDDAVLRLVPAHGVDAAELLTAVTPSTLLALRNTQLAVLGRVRHAEVHASQRRIVAASDAERHRIERDLHDGAQQRLVSVTFHLRLAMARAEPELGAHLTKAEARIHDALAELRRLAHGVFPAVLSEEGLAAALEDLVGSAAAVDVTLRAEVRPEPDAAVGMAAYTTVAAVLTAAQQAHDDAPIAIDVFRVGKDVTVRIETAAAWLVATEASLVDAADRVGAAGGRMDVTRTGRAMVITAVIPCAS